MSTRKILVIDDEQAYTRMITFALEDTGEFKVRTVNDPTQAAETARLFDPDCCVLDIIMPEMSGLEVAELFKRDPVLKNKPIVFLTAAVSKEHPHIQHDLLEDCPVLIKPVGSDELIACIDSVTTGANRKAS